MPICLTCLQNSTCVQQINSTHNFLKLSISDMLTYCTSIKLECNQGYPESICNNCLCTLTIIYQFKKKALTSFQKLKNNLSKRQTTTTVGKKGTKVKGVQVGIFNTKIIYEDEPNDVEPINERDNSIVVPDVGETLSNIESNLDEDLVVETLIFEATVEEGIEQNQNENEASCEQIIIEVVQEEVTADNGVSGDATGNDSNENAGTKIGNQIEGEPSNSKRSPPKIPKTTHEETNSATAARNGVFPCTQCPKTFKRKEQLHRHEEFHAGIRYQCVLCQKIFLTKANLCVHIDSIHGNATKYPCAFCERTFATRKRLACHAHTHSAKARYTCDLCGNKYRYRSSYTYHLKKHYNAREYKCHLCPASFNIQPELKCHVNKHLGIFEYTCTICGRGYRIKTNFIAHMNKHAGTRPHKCETCGKGFTTLPFLRRHEVRHYPRLS